MAEPYVRSEFKLTATIDGNVFRDVVGISATFGLNSIPMASLHVASGVNVQTGKPAKIHDAINSIKPRSKAVVKLTVKTTDGQTDKMINETDMVIFEGYYAGMGYQRSTSNATFTLHLLHWLDDLNCSSMLNGNWFHGAPHDLAQAASNYSCRLGGANSTGDGEVNIAPIVDAAPSLITHGNMEGDLWEKVIKPIFEAVANMPHILEQNAAGNAGGADASGIGGGDNKAAQDALKRMPGVAPIPGTLPMNLPVAPDIIEYSTNNGISHLILNGISYSSFWSKLVGELGASFLFGVSPGVEFANVVPYFAGLSTPWKTIKADEYNYASFNCSVANLIESVDIFYAPQSATNCELTSKIQGGPISYYHPWGRYPSRNQNFRGQILIRNPPVWLANVSTQSMKTPATTLPPNGDSHTPQHGSGTVVGPTSTEAEMQIRDGGLLNNFCEHWYKSAVLGQRSGELSGKLRFDIAPGSIVAIEAPDTEIGNPETMYGMVTQVSYVINAEQHTAGTSFSLTSLRNKTENENEYLTKATPPLYKNAWSGGPLTVKY